MPRWTKEQLEEFEARKRKGDVRRSPTPKPEGKPLIEIFCPRKPDRLNKTEAAFLEHLRWGMGDSTGEARILSQQLKFRLADKTWYLPDFVAVSSGQPIKIYEVKGFMRDDAAVKLKTCAEQYWMFEWYLVTKEKGGGWKIVRVGRPE